MKTVRENLAREIKEMILKEHDAEGQIEREFEKLKPILNEKAKELSNEVVEDLTKKPDQSWRDPVRKLAYSLAKDVSLTE